MKSRNFAGVFLFLFLFLSFQTVSAQNNTGITVIPATIEEAVDPGSAFQSTLKVTNESEAEREFFIFKKNIKGVEAGGVPIFAESDAEVTGYEITEWIQLPFDRVTIAPFETIEVPVNILVPDSATPGSHFGGIFVSLEPPRLRESGAGVGYEVASILSIRINGDIDDTARVRSFSTDKLFYSEKKVHFTAKIENQGNILIRPRGPLTITGMFGEQPEVISINEKLAGVFPGTVRDLEFTWESEGLGFGRYEAILALAYEGEDGQITIDASLVFWVFPVKTMLTIGGIFLAIFLLGYFLTRYYINQAIMRAGGGRRIVSQRYRRQVGVSRFTFVFTVLMAVTLLFLLILLVFSA